VALGCRQYGRHTKLESVRQASTGRSKPNAPGTYLKAYLDSLV